MQVAAEVQGELFLLSVTNQGEPIPECVRSRLFQPYSRPVTDAPQAGLGLGLYIASEIAPGSWRHAERVLNPGAGHDFYIQHAAQFSENSFLN